MATRSSVQPCVRAGGSWGVTAASTPAEALLGPAPHLLLCSPQNLVRWCDSSPCKNGGKCWQTNNLYRCECNSGWTGLYCDVPSVSCEVAAKQQGQSLLHSVLLVGIFGTTRAISRIAVTGTPCGCSPGCAHRWDVWWPGRGPAVRGCHRGPSVSLCSPRQVST